MRTGRSGPTGAVRLEKLLSKLWTMVGPWPIPTQRRYARSQNRGSQSKRPRFSPCATGFRRCFHRYPSTQCHRPVAAQANPSGSRRDFVIEHQAVTQASMMQPRPRGCISREIRASRLVREARSPARRIFPPLGRAAQIGRRFRRLKFLVDLNRSGPDSDKLHQFLRVESRLETDVILGSVPSDVFRPFPLPEM